MFGKTDQLAVIIRRVEGRVYRDRRELGELLAQIEAQPVPVQLLLGLLGHGDEEVRACATRCLAHAAAAGAVEELLRAMLDQPEPVRHALATAALASGANRVDGYVGPMVTAKRPEQRQVAMTVIEAHPHWQRHLTAIKVLLADPADELRRRAARQLAKDAAHPAIFLLLKDLLHHDDPGLRREALQALAATRNPDIVEPFLERLPLEADVERMLIVRALSALARDPRVKLDEKILPALADERPPVREAAVELLSHLPDRTRFLRSFLVESAELAYWLRERCVKALLTVAESLVEPLLALMRDADENVRVGALMLAANIREPRFFAPMRELFLSRTDWWIRVLAADVLAGIGNPEVVACLAGQLGDHEVRYGVIAALGKTKSPHAFPPLLQALRDPVPGIRSCSLDALRGAVDHSVISAVARVAAGDPVDAMREKAISVLATMGPGGAAAVAELERRLAPAAAPGEVPAGGALGLEMLNPALNAPGLGITP